MSFEIKTGLFLLDDFVDHHAILGVPVGAEASAIRKRYLKIARRLHPDSLASHSDADRKKATELLSKMVNPAYETTSQDKHRKEYLILLKLKGKQALQQKLPVSGFCNEAKKLMKCPNVDLEYQQQIKILSADQYDDLSQFQAKVGKLTELNLIYLMRTGGSGAVSSQSATAAAPPASATGQPNGARPIAPSAGTYPGGSGPATVVQNTPQRLSLSEGYLRRAEEYVRKRAYSQAILELRDGLRADPKDSRCHSLMGIVYMHQKQATMAKVSIKRALELDPKDTRALEAKRLLERQGHKIEVGREPGLGVPSSTTTGSRGGNSSGSSSGSSSGNSSGSSSNSGKADKKGGLFGNLFGGKKK